MVVGGGRMGEALVGGLLTADWADVADLTVVEPDGERRSELSARFPGLRVTDAPALGDGAVVAVKPTLVTRVSAQLGDLGVGRILSIAAGVRLAAIEAVVPAGTAVVRAMPNTPSLVRQGAAAIAGGQDTDEGDLDWAEGILRAVGTVVRVDEASLDAVTGLSGSGPGYVFLFAEALVDAGVLVGLPRQVAHDLVVQTLRGAAELMATGAEPSELRAGVTSPGGTTAAGLRALESGGVRSALADAVVAATERSRQLASSSP